MSKRKRSRSIRFNYGKLEPRQLLAVTGFSQFDGDTDVQSGLIENGNFDANTVADATAETVDVTNIAGWNATTGASSQVSLFGFEDSPRNTVLRLDFQANTVESIYQDVTTTDAQAYTLAFDIRGRTADATADVTTNDVRVLWDGAEVGTFRGDTFWQTVAIRVVGPSDGETRLEIQEVDGAGNDGVGALIDNVRLIEVTEETLTNGSFESGAAGEVNSSTVDGWTVVGEEADRLIEIVNDSTAPDGSQYINLDNTDARTDILFADIATESGATYFVSFDLKASGTTSSASEELRVRWGTDWAGTYRGNADWQSFGFTVTADSDSTLLTLREPGGTGVNDNGTGDGVGPFLDNIRIRKVNATAAVTLDGTSEFTFVENGADTDVGDGLRVATTSTGGNLSGATLRFSDDATFGDETLSVDVGSTGITSNYNSATGTLLLDGNASAADYQTVLNTLSYGNTSDDPTTGVRRVSVVVRSGSSSSAAAFVSIDVSAVNDAPTISAIADTSTRNNAEFSTQVSTSDPDDSSLTYSVTSTGTAIETGDAEPTISATGLLTWLPVRTGTQTITVTVSDPNQATVSEEFVVTVTQAEAIDTAAVSVLSGTDLPIFDSTLAVDPAVGTALPSFTTKTLFNEDFASSSPGTGRVYGFFAHWCPACQRELPGLADYLNDNELPDNVEFVAAAIEVDPVTGDNNYPPADWFEREDFNETVIVDNTQDRLLEIFGVPGYPFFVAVDSEGSITERASGEITDAKLQELIDSVTPPVPPSN